MSTQYRAAHSGPVHFLSAHFGGILDLTIHPPGTKPRRGISRRRLIEEDELLLSTLMAFLHVKDD